MALQHVVPVFALTCLLLCSGNQAQLECGIARQNTRIVGGENSSPGVWPWQVSLVTQNTHFCGGSLVSDLWVLTAAHCIMGDEVDTTTVYLGRFMRAEENPFEEQRRIAEIHCHESYDFLTNENDICLLKLASPVVFSDFIGPVCLPTNNSTFYTGTSTWVTGWGNTDPNEYSLSELLKEVNLPVVGNNECQCLQWYLITDLMMCAGTTEGGKDACQGDSGGPMVVKVDPIRSKWVQSGIVSFGEACAKPNVPAVYTRVSMYEDWIKTITTGNLPGFVTFTSGGEDPDLNYVCSSKTTTEAASTTSVTTTEDDSVFSGGENGIFNFISVSLPLLLYLFLFFCSEI